MESSKFKSWERIKMDRTSNLCRSTQLQNIAWLLRGRNIYLYTCYWRSESVSQMLFLLKHAWWLRFVFSLGGIIMFGGIFLFDQEFIHVVTITFTALILTELLMVALTIRTWHWLMLLAEVFSLAIYVGTLAIFRRTFGKFCIPLFVLFVCKSSF